MSDNQKRFAIQFLIGFFGWFLVISSWWTLIVLVTGKTFFTNHWNSEFAMFVSIRMVFFTIIAIIFAAGIAGKKGKVTGGLGIGLLSATMINYILNLLFVDLSNSGDGVYIMLAGMPFYYVRLITWL